MSLAMLDEEGVIVAWYERAVDRDASESLVKRHVSHLYLPDDVALGIPMRDLSTAAIHGQCVQAGWRRGGDGTKYWAVTTIEPALRHDGRLQGFALRTHHSPIPWNLASETSSRWGSTHDKRRVSTVAVACALLATLAIPTTAYADVDRIPPNARASKFAAGWECTHGFRRDRDACAEIAVPANAYMDASGNRWRCARGYLAVDNRCAFIKVPANAYLDDSYGTGWRCERGYREARGECLAIRIPVNAHEVESSYGAGWECNYGYALSAGQCEAVIVPANAYLTRMGTDWKCNRGFATTPQGCAVVELPQHAYLNDDGDNWTCERGFSQTQSGCRAIELPANAHFNYSGDRWQCNRGFRDRSGSCIEE